MGRVSVDAGRVVRRYDRRLDNEKRPQVGAPCDILASGCCLDPYGDRALRGARLRHQLHRGPLLLGYHHGCAGTYVALARVC